MGPNRAVTSLFCTSARHEWTGAATAGMAGNLRLAGAVIVGKTNLSEWANFRSFQSSSGWSSRAGHCLMPNVLDHDGSGSSTGSAAAVAANFAAGTIGTEADGSTVP